MTAKEITLSKAQIRALYEAREYLMQWNNRNNSPFSDNYRRFCGWTTTKSLIGHGLFETRSDAHLFDKNFARITPAGIAWLEAHEAEVGS